MTRARAPEPGPLAGRRSVVGWAVASLVGNMGIILTGALVRLTSSGLGCSTWPKCTADSVIPAGQGIHGAIEFGNRLVTFVLVALAIGTFVAALRVRTARGARRPDLVRLSVIAALGIPAQAVLGGITVLVRLNPYVVAMHLLVSVAIIVVLVLLVRRARGLAPRPVSRRGRTAVIVAFALAMLVVVAGTLVTGSAQHSGDAAAARTGFAVEAVARIHAVIGWALLATTALAWWWTRARSVLWLGLGVIVQALVGEAQFFTGLPVWIVAIHMIGVAVVSALAANCLFSVRPATTAATDPPPASAVPPLQAHIGRLDDR